MDKNIWMGRLLSKIGGIICLSIAAVVILISIVTPVTITINGEQFIGRIWEIARYSSAFTFWLGILFYLIVLGVAGLYIGKRAVVKPTKGLGIILILLGFPALPVIGAGLLYMIAGVHIVFAAGMKDLQNPF